MWSCEIKATAAPVKTAHPNAMQRVVAADRALNEVAFRYATRLYNGGNTLDPARHVAELLAFWAPPLAPSLHVDDHPGYSVRGLSEWVTLLSAHRGEYDPALLEAKQPTGHARVLSCTTDDDSTTLVRAIQERVRFVYIDATHLFTRGALPKLFGTVLPKVVDRGGWVIVRLQTPNDGELARVIVDAAAKGYGSLHLCKPTSSDLLSQEVYAVLQGHGSVGGCPTTLDGWWHVTSSFTERWNAHVRSAHDVFAYLDAIGLETDTQCRQHHDNAQT